MELETASTEELQIVKTSKLSTVTPFSKYLAMGLFVALPFLGGWIGYTYAPEKIVEGEKVATQEVEEPLSTEKPVTIQQAVSVIQTERSGWPSLSKKYDYSGTTSIPWYKEPITQPDVTVLNKSNPRNAFDTCGFHREGGHDESFITEIKNGFNWEVGANYNGMTYEGFECIGEEPRDQTIRFVFTGDFSARGITSHGLGPNRFHVSKESAKNFNFLPLVKRQSLLVPADTSSIWRMHSYGQNSSGIEMTVSSNFLYYHVSPAYAYEVAEAIFTESEIGFDGSYEYVEFDILGYELHEVRTEPINWDNF